MVIKLGKNTLKKSAGECKAFLKERYNKDSKITPSDIEETIEHYYPKEEADKKAKLDGDTIAAKQESPTSKK